MSEAVKELFEEVLEKYRETEFYSNYNYFGSQEKLQEANDALEEEVESYRKRFEELS